MKFPSLNCGAKRQPPAKHSAQVDGPHSAQIQSQSGATRCPCCGHLETSLVRKVEDVSYHSCHQCELIFADPAVLERLDRGLPIRDYDAKYWAMELKASRERCFGVALARMAELFYYSRIPIRRYLDVGAGPGYFLDAIAKYLPSRCDIFWAVEKFPPAEEFRTKWLTYRVGEVGDLEGKFDAGQCIEVIEHLTPSMLRRLLAQIAAVSNEQSIYFFNTGLPEFVLHENLAYLDPYRRGHVLSWSVKAIASLAEPLGFTVFPIRGKRWAFVLEYHSRSNRTEDIRHRAWSALKENLESLTDPEMGSVLKVLGLESIRAYAPM